jgi:hypothetical protein
VCDDCNSLEDEVLQWRQYFEIEYAPLPPGAASRHLRLVIHLNQIRREHVRALASVAYTDRRLMELLHVISGMTGL